MVLEAATIFRSELSLASPSIWLTLSALLVVAGYVVYQCHFAALAKFPGPLLFKLSRGWYAYRTATGLWHRELMDLHAKYGAAVRIAPDEISVADPAAHTHIYSAAQSAKFVKAPAYTVIKGHRTFDLSTEANVEVHGRQRKLVSRVYTMDSIRRLQPAVDEVINIVMEKLEKYEGQTTDLGYWIQAFAFDVVGAVSFSRIFGFVQRETDDGELLRLKDSITSIGWVQHVPWFLRLHNALQPIIGNRLAINDRLGHFYDMSHDEVETWKARDRPDRDMVKQLVQVQKDHPEDFDDRNLKYMMSTNIFAGSDTTSTSIRGTMLLLLRNPHTLQRLVQELDTKKTKGELSDPVTFEEAEGCPYLQAVLWEGVRLYPAIGSALARVVPAGGMMIDGKFVPQGTIVGSSGYVINRLESIWGKDANEFRPERWLEADKDQLTQMKRYFFTFGGGSRTCIGRNLSWLEMAKLIPTILLKYNLTLVDEDLHEEYGFLVFIVGLKVKVERRVDGKKIA